MECGQTGVLGEPAPLLAGEVIRIAPGTAPIRNRSTEVLIVSGTPRTRPRPVTQTLVPVSSIVQCNIDTSSKVEYCTSSNSKIL